MKKPIKLDLDDVINSYMKCGSLSVVATLLGCTRQHIHNEITRQTKVSGIKQLMSDRLRSK